jgi:Protein of unknown function (DUF2934)
MANEVDEQRIREHAYDLWRQDGEPEGQAEGYWEKALRQILTEGGAAPVSTGQSDSDSA